MTINSFNRVAGPYLGNGVTTNFGFSFKIFSSADLQIVQTDPTGAETILTSGFTVSLNSDQDANPGGSITLTTALATGYKLTLTSSISATQATDLTNQGGFYPKVITNALDKLTILIQQLFGLSGRQVAAPISDGTVNFTLPAAASRASKLLGFSSDGMSLVVADPGGQYDSTLRADLANTTTAGKGKELIGIRRTATEIATGVMPVSYAYDTTPYNQLLRHLPSAPDLSGATDYSTALQNCINICELSGEAMILPPGKVGYATTLAIAGTAKNGFQMCGVSSGEYASTSALEPSRGSILKYTGSGDAINIDGGAKPKFLELHDVSLVGSALATSGISIRRATNMRFEGGAVWGFTNAAGYGAVKINKTASEFSGVIDFVKVNFCNNYRALKALNSSVNFINSVMCRFMSNVLAVEAGDAALVNDFRTWNFISCDWEENQKELVCYGGAQGWNFIGNYFEDSSTSTTERIWFKNNGLSAQHSGLLFEGNTWSRQLSAAQRLIALESVAGARIIGGWSAFPLAGAGVTDRWTVDADAGCTDLEVVLPSVVSGATPYPIRYNGTVYTTGINTRAMNLLGQLTVGSYPLLRSYMPQNVQSSNYTFALSDMAKRVVNGGTTTIYTIPPNSSVAFPIGTRIYGCNSNAVNNLSLARGAGVTLLLGNVNKNVTIAPSRNFVIEQVAADYWVVDDCTGAS